MNTMKATKWSGTALLWLGIVTGLLALASVWTARHGLNWLSQLKPAHADQEQRDQVLPGWEKAQTAPDTGKDTDENYRMGVHPTIDPSRRTTDNAVPLDPSEAVDMVPSGWAKTLDPSGRVLDLAAMTLAVDPTEAGAITPAGWAKTLDNTGRLLLDADVMTSTVDPTKAGDQVPDGWAKMVDNTGR